jgi:type II secretory pathway component PulF
MKFAFSIPPEAQINFVKNLAMMLKSGISITEALESGFSQAKNPTLKSALGRIKIKVEHGTSLGEAFEDEGRIFGPIFTILIRAGEKSGQLEENIDFIAHWMEQNNDLKNDIKSATLYPKIVIVVALVIGTGLTLFVLPKLMTIFTGLKVELPMSTKILMAISTFGQDHWLGIIIALITLIVGFIGLNYIRSVKKKLQNFYLRVPFFGVMIQNYEIALFAQLLSTLFKSGIRLVEALSIIQKTSRNIPYQDSIESLKGHIEKGMPLSEVMKGKNRLYPENFVSVIAAGEKSGSLEDAFGYLKDFYAKEVNSKAKKIPSIIEPILLILITLMVGFIAMAIITPIYKITSGIN